MSMDKAARLLEALLFAAEVPLSARELHERLPEGTDVGAALSALQTHYEGRGVTLTERDGAWAFRTAPDLADQLTLERTVAQKLSRAALETLAIIAYHQPVTRAEIENIRGVSTSRGTLDLLMEADWIKPGRRRNTPGRPLTWVSTPSFLDHFSLESLTDLPGLDDLKAAGLLDKRPAIESIPSEQDLFDEAAEHDTTENEDIQTNDQEDMII